MHGLPHARVSGCLPDKQLSRGDVAGTIRKLHPSLFAMALTDECEVIGGQRKALINVRFETGVHNDRILADVF